MNAAEQAEALPAASVAATLRLVVWSPGTVAVIPPVPLKAGGAPAAQHGAAAAGVAVDPDGRTGLGPGSLHLWVVVPGGRVRVGVGDRRGGRCSGILGVGKGGRASRCVAGGVGRRRPQVRGLVGWDVDGDPGRAELPCCPAGELRVRAARGRVDPNGRARLRGPLDLRVVVVRRASPGRCRSGREPRGRSSPRCTRTPPSTLRRCRRRRSRSPAGWWSGHRGR